MNKSDLQIISKKLSLKERQKIAKKLDVSISLINQILCGAKQNDEILNKLADAAIEVHNKEIKLKEQLKEKVDMLNKEAETA